MTSKKPVIIDLFAGVGGFSLGAARAGFDLALAVELDKHALAGHKQNFPNVEHLQVDVSTLTGYQLLKAAGLKIGELDGLVGGPPCQGFSAIGKRNVEDSRNNLFVKFFELVSECQPRFFIAENVLGILYKKYDDIRLDALNFVKEDYTLLPPMKLRASDFGAPTTRERVFFIGYKNDVDCRLSVGDFEKYKIEEQVTVSDALKGLPINIDKNWITEDSSWRPVEELPRSSFWDRVTGYVPENVGDEESLHRIEDEGVVSGCFGTRHTQPVEKRYDALKPGERDSISRSVRLKKDGLCPTIRAGTGSDRGSFQAVRPIHPTEPRVITPREAARLQGFPDWFRFAPTKWHSFRQIGNSVSPILAEVIFKVLVSHLDLMEDKEYAQQL